VGWAADRDVAGPTKSSRAGTRVPAGSLVYFFDIGGLTGCLMADATPEADCRRPLAGAADRWFVALVRRGGVKMAVDLSMPVLVVDDYNTMIRIIRNLLKQLGFENIDDASDGSAALNKMRGKKYGLVISDWNMEPMTGYDLLREVRADPNLAITPFIMITAESKTENVIAAKKAGVNNYIVKPFNAATLKTKIEAVFPDLATA
jgi:two-component system, chemotaxis family, chemotaxis protein CheY